jgi:hypothetical protein
VPLAEGFDRAQVSDDGVAVLGDLAAEGGQRGAVEPAVDQPPAEAVFQSGDGAADCGLGQAECPGGAGEAAMLVHGEHGLDVPNGEVQQPMISAHGRHA